MSVLTPIRIETMAPDDTAVAEAIGAMLDAYNATHGAPWQAQPILIAARAGDGTIQGGLRGHINWSWCFVDALVVAEPLRGQDIGSGLLARAETAARESGCIGIHLWSVSFQAPDFYRRLGYHEFGRLDEHPPGRSSHWFMKRL
jgi:GNAT superfamily N-acetyltransferase